MFAVFNDVLSASNPLKYTSYLSTKVTSPIHFSTQLPVQHVLDQLVLEAVQLPRVQDGELPRLGTRQLAGSQEAKWLQTSVRLKVCNSRKN